MRLRCRLLPGQCKRNKRRIRILETTCHDLNFKATILRRPASFFASTSQPNITVVLLRCAPPESEVDKIIAMPLNRCAMGSYRSNRFSNTQSWSTEVVAISRTIPRTRGETCKGTPPKFGFEMGSREITSATASCYESQNPGTLKVPLREYACITK